MRRVGLVVVSLAVLICLAAIHGTVIAATGFTTRVSVASDGAQANQSSDDLSLSGDGRYVAFESGASNLVVGDTNGKSDIFLRDRQTGQTSRISVDSQGRQANGDSHSTSISDDGRYVAFESEADNLVMNDNNNVSDIFVHDSETGITIRVSVDSIGNEGNDESEYPSISSDGYYIAFKSAADNLVMNDNNDTGDIFVHDSQTGQTNRVSVASSGKEGNNESKYPAISGDGRYVAFLSFASNLVDNDTNGVWDVFVRDRQMGETKRVSVNSNGSQLCGTYRLGDSVMSDDGRFIVFVTTANIPMEGDINYDHDVYVHDQVTGETKLVSVASDGTIGNSFSYSPSISADGNLVAFISDASNLVSADTNQRMDAFIHDRVSGETKRVSIASDGTEGNDHSYLTTISADGISVAFLSTASNLVLGDTNKVQDVFVHYFGGSNFYLPIIVISH